MQISFQRVLLIVNSILLLLALSFIALFLVYKLAPKRVNAFGAHRIEQYIQAGQSRAKNAIKALENGDPSKANDILNDWSEVGKSDRYYRYKRDVFIALSKHWTNTGEFNNILDASKQFTRADKRDLIVSQVWSKAALNIPKYRDLAKNEIYEKWNLFPQNQNLSELYMHDVLDWTDKNKVEDALNRSAYFTPGKTKGGWAIYWAPNMRFTGKQVKFPPLVTNGKYRTLKTILPKNTRWIRIDPPSGSYLNIEDVSVKTRDRQHSYAPESFKTLNMVKIVGNKLQTLGGNDPFFSINLSPLWKAGSASEQIEVTVSFKVDPIFPIWLEKKLKHFR